MKAILFRSKYQRDYFFSVVLVLLTTHSFGQFNFDFTNRDLNKKYISVNGNSLLTLLEVITPPWPKGELSMDWITGSEFDLICTEDTSELWTRRIEWKSRFEPKYSEIGDPATNSLIFVQYPYKYQGLVATDLVCRIDAIQENGEATFTDIRVEDLDSNLNSINEVNVTDVIPTPLGIYVHIITSLNNHYTDYIVRVDNSGGLHSKKIELTFNEGKKYDLTFGSLRYAGHTENKLIFVQAKKTKNIIEFSQLHVNKDDLSTTQLSLSSVDFGDLKKMFYTTERIEEVSVNEFPYELNGNLCNTNWISTIYASHVGARSHAYVPKELNGLFSVQLINNEVVFSGFYSSKKSDQIDGIWSFKWPISGDMNDLTLSKRDISGYLAKKPKSMGTMGTLQIGKRNGRLVYRFFTNSYSSSGHSINETFILFE